MIPFFPPDLFEQDRDVLIDLVHEIGTTPDQKFILGTRTAAFEDALRTLYGAGDVIACSSGTSALTLVLRAMDIGPGDEVVVPAYGCAPLANTVAGLGATPVFADIDPWTMVADPQAMDDAVTARTKALMPAHMFSVMADMPALRKLADDRGVRLVEDSAVAQGGVLDGRPAGTWGTPGFSRSSRSRRSARRVRAAPSSPRTRRSAAPYGRCATTVRRARVSSTNAWATTAASTRSSPPSSCTGCPVSPPAWNAGPASPRTTPSGSPRCARPVSCPRRPAATAAASTSTRSSSSGATRSATTSPSAAWPRTSTIRCRCRSSRRSPRTPRPGGAGGTPSAPRPGNSRCPSTRI